MKPFALCLIIAAASLLGSSGQAQYKGPRDYFPKNYPAPRPGGGAAPTATNGMDKATSPKGQQPKFKELPVNTSFYFLSDTNRAYNWTKTSVSQAKNNKNGIVQTISGETPVQR